MKLIKFLPFLVLVICFSSLYLSTKIHHIDKQQIDPISEKNNFIFQLAQSLDVAHFKYSNFNLEDFQNQVEFTIIKSDNPTPSLITLSTKKDAAWQVATLQQVFDTSKNKGKYVKFIDLSIEHPYATFQNN